MLISYQELATQKLVFVALAVIVAHWPERSCSGSCCVYRKACAQQAGSVSGAHVLVIITTWGSPEPGIKAAGAPCPGTLKLYLLKKPRFPPRMSTFKKAGWLGVGGSRVAAPGKAHVRSGGLMEAGREAECPLEFLLKIFTFVTRAFTFVTRAFTKV